MLAIPEQIHSDHHVVPESNVHSKLYIFLAREVWEVSSQKQVEHDIIR